MAFLKTQLIFQGPVFRRVNLKSHIQNVSSTLGKLSFQLSISPAFWPSEVPAIEVEQANDGKCLLSGILKSTLTMALNGIKSVFESGEHKTCNNNNHHHHQHHLCPLCSSPSSSTQWPSRWLALSDCLPSIAAILKWIPTWRDKVWCLKDFLPTWACVECTETRSSASWCFCFLKIACRLHC